MNKTLSIGLAGFSFIIEEHAYIKLSDYLKALKSSLDPTEADEVMHDIEIRMVEIFRANLIKRDVINDADVEKVIAQIGRPEVIEEHEGSYYSENKQKTEGTNNNNRKKLFRDPEKQKVAGVCAGLAQYFGMDITLMRAIWVIVFLIMIPAAGSALLLVLLYAILWAVLPKAQTASEFLQMRGEPINFDTLKSESNKFVQFANESGQRIGEIYNENKPFVRETTSSFANALRYLFGGLFALISFACLTGAIAGLIFLSNGGVEGSVKNEVAFLLEEDGMNYLLSAIAIIAALIPAFIFGVLSLKLFSPNYKVKNVGWVLGGLFLLLMGLSIFFGFYMVGKSEIYKGQKNDTEELAINTASDTIYVDLQKINIPQKFTAYDDDLFSDKKTVFIKDNPYGSITRKDNIKTPYLIVKRNAEGYNIPMSLTVPVTITGNRVQLPNFISYPYSQRFRDYNVEYELVVPTKTTVIITDKDRIIIEEDQDTNSSSTANSNNYGTVKINGNTISTTKEEGDSIIINGKKYSEPEGKKIIDSIKSDIKKTGKVDLQVKGKDGGVTVKVE